uniref:Uncharacterized protein n=1 Tax=Cacopsylla melanoneura TaxID=428564 RepID=A0A8D8ZYL4_9HEMI
MTRIGTRLFGKVQDTVCGAVDSDGLRLDVILDGNGFDTILLKSIVCLFNLIVIFISKNILVILDEVIRVSMANMFRTPIILVSVFTKLLLLYINTIYCSGSGGV